jgi:hypothetical protein
MIRLLNAETLFRFVSPKMDHGADTIEELQEKLLEAVEAIRSEGEDFMVDEVVEQLAHNARTPAPDRLAVNGHLDTSLAGHSGVEPIVACGADLYKLPDDEQVFGPEVTCPDCLDLIRRAEQLVEA